MNPSKLLPCIFLFVLASTSLFAQKYNLVIEYRDTTYEVVKDFQINKKILFKTDEYGLLAPEVLKLDKIISQAKKNFDYEISMTGYADFRGSDGYNDTLAERRIKTTRDYFLLRRLKNDKIQSQVVGEIPPSVEVVNPDEDLQPDRVVNVKATIYYKEEVQDSIMEVYSIMTCPENDTLIRFANGVEVEVIGCSFPKHLIRDLTFDCVFASTRQEMLSNRLTTVTNGGECLQTSGMVFLNVTNDKGKKMFTIPEAPMTIRIPTQTFEEGVELFDATNPSSNSPTWTLSEYTLRTLTEECFSYYTFQSVGNVAKNLDKPTGVFSSSSPTGNFKVSGFQRKHAQAYLSGSRTNLKGKFMDKRQFKYPASACIPDNEQMVTVYIKKKKWNFIYHRPIWMVTQRKGNYRIRKRECYRVPTKTNMYQLVMN